MTKRIILVLASLAILAGCGVKGGLERPPKKEKETSAVHVSAPFA